MNNGTDVNFDDFEVVNEKGTQWECKQTGKQKDGSLVRLEPSDKSYIVGYYLGCDTGVGLKQNSTVHKLKILRDSKGNPVVGDVNHLSGDPAETNDLITIWGTGVLDGKLAESVTPGKLIKITWKGKAKSKKSGDEYHNWEVAVNNRVAPFTVIPRVADEFEPDENDIEETAEETSPAMAPNNDFDDDDF